mgnify:CR=1 FL=1
MRISQKQIDEHFEEKGIKDTALKYVKLKCTLCGLELDIHVNDEKLYTKEVKSKWICCFCSKKNKNSFEQ